MATVFVRQVIEFDELILLEVADVKRDVELGSQLTCGGFGAAQVVDEQRLGPALETLCDVGCVGAVVMIASYHDRPHFWNVGTWEPFA